MRIIKPFIGILLIVSSVLGMIWWEKEGRPNLLMADVLVAKSNIEKGEYISKEDFKEVKVMKGNLIEGSYEWKDWVKFSGKMANQHIPKNSQVNDGMFLLPEEIVKKGESIFSLKPWWIHSRSSSLRKGDLVDIYDSTGKLYCGTFKVAYVKDEEEQEIIDAEGKKGEELLERKFSTGVINHVEIIAQLHEYEYLRGLAEEQGMSFLIVQKGV